MIAKLVYIDLLVRVLVPDDATDDEIRDLAAEKANKTLQSEGIGWLAENSGEIKDDTECPATEEEGGKIAAKDTYDTSEDTCGDRDISISLMGNTFREDVDVNYHD